MIVILLLFLYFFFFNDTATTEIYTLSLHDALPIYFEEVELSVVRAAYELGMRRAARESECGEQFTVQARQHLVLARRSEEHTSELQSQSNLVCRLLLEKKNK